MIESGIFGDVVQRSCGARQGTPSSEYESFDSMPDDRACAHRAWLYGDKQFVAFQPPIAVLNGSLPHSAHLGVSSAVAQKFPSVVGLGNDLFTSDEYRTDGDVSVLQGDHRFVQRQSHEMLIPIHDQVAYASST